MMYEMRLFSWPDKDIKLPKMLLALMKFRTEIVLLSYSDVQMELGEMFELFTRRSRLKIREFFCEFSLPVA